MVPSFNEVKELLLEKKYHVMALCSNEGAEQTTNTVQLDSTTLSVIYQNVRGLNTKTATFFNTICATLDEYDIVVITESWLKPSVFNSELFPSEFTVFRRDRDFELAGKCNGGGVLLAIKNCYRCQEVNLNFNESDIDILCVKITTSKSMSLYIFTVYISPNCSLLSLENLFNFLENLPYLYNSRHIIIGDFNISKLNDYYTDNNVNDPHVNELLNFLNFLNCEQYNFNSNHLNRLLDLVIANVHCGVSRAIFGLVEEDMHHPTLQINVSLNVDKVKDLKANLVSNYNFKKGNYPLMYELFMNVDWTELELITDINCAVDFFYQKIYSIFDICVPKAKYSKKYPVWFNRQIIITLKKKESIRKRYKKTGLTHLKNEYVNLRSKLKRDIDLAYESYLNKIQQDISEDTRSFWQFINSKKDSISIPNVMNLKGNEYKTGSAIADAFANHFNSVYTFDNNTDVSHIKLAPHVNEVIVNSITNDDIYEAVKHLKVNKAIGPDKIPSYIIKGCVDFFVYPLNILFNLSLKTKTFPDAWKEVKICPIFKKGDKNNIENYRPIAVLSVPAKLFESIIFKSIYNVVQNQISIYQHGFMRNRSTVSNLSNITQFISDTLEDRGQVDVVYTDFQKAFDSVSHKILISKLSNEFGFHENLVEFMSSYLQSRKQRVIMKGYSSKPYIATSGVPQGSNLGPLLFLMFINSITKLVKSSKILLFADDLKIFLRVDEEADCLKLQHDLNIIYTWSIENKLFFNIGKCSTMSFTRKHNIIDYTYRIDEAALARVSEMRDLGVTFDSQITFNEHIIIMTKKASKMYGFIVRNSRQFNNLKCIRQLYISFVRSILEYCSIIWSPYYRYQIYNVEKIQNKFLRYLNYKETGVYDITIPKEDLLLQYNLDTLEKRRKISCVMYLHKIIENGINDLSYLSLIYLIVPTHSTRNSRTFYLETAHTNSQINSPLYRMCSLYNSIQDTVDIFHITQSKLKYVLRDVV